MEGRRADGRSGLAVPGLTWLRPYQCGKAVPAASGSTFASWQVRAGRRAQHTRRGAARIVSVTPQDLGVRISSSTLGDYLTRFKRMFGRNRGAVPAPGQVE